MHRRTPASIFAFCRSFIAAATPGRDPIEFQ
jgi:hypothetical protein